MRDTETVKVGATRRTSGPAKSTASTTLSPQKQFVDGLASDFQSAVMGILAELRSVTAERRRFERDQDPPIADNTPLPGGPP